MKWQNIWNMNREIFQFCFFQKLKIFKNFQPSQWYDALRAVARLPTGLPQEFRKSVWLSLANRHIKHLKLDWPKTVRFTFNDRSNPDDDTLGVQIVKVRTLTDLIGWNSDWSYETNWFTLPSLLGNYLPNLYTSQKYPTDLFWLRDHPHTLRGNLLSSRLVLTCLVISLVICN